MSEDYFETSAPLVVNDRTREVLGRTVKWSKVIAIFCFVYCGFLLLGAISMGFMGGAMGRMMSTAATPVGPFQMTIFAVLYAILAVVYYFPALYLYRFSERLPQAMADNKIDEFNAALEYHRKYYKFCGILVIVSAAILVLTMIYIFFFVFKTIATAGM